MRSSSEQEQANQKHDASTGTESEQEAAAGSGTFYGNMQTFIWDYNPGRICEASSPLGSGAALWAVAHADPFFPRVPSSDWLPADT